MPLYKYLNIWGPWFAQETDFAWEERFTLSGEPIEISASYNIDLSV